MIEDPIENCVRSVRDIVNGEDLMEVWNEFVRSDPWLVNYRKEWGEKTFDRFMLISDNTTESIAKLFDGNYKEFVENTIDAYTDGGDAYWSAGDDWLVREPDGKANTEGYADDMIAYILNNIGVIDITEEDAVKIAQRFLNYVRKEYNIETFTVTRSYVRRMLDEIWHDRPVSGKYWGKIADKILEEVCEDIEETADKDEWGEDDVRQAVGRVLCTKLGIEI